LLLLKLFNICQPIRSPSATDLFVKAESLCGASSESDQRITCGPLIPMVSNIKKNKVGSKGCHIVTGTAGISFSHGVITRERHKKVTLATHLSKLSRKKNCYISTTYKIVKILTSHFCIIRHYIYIRGTTYVSHIRLYNLMIYITKYKNVSIYVSSSLSNSPTTMTNLSDCR